LLNLRKNPTGGVSIEMAEPIADSLKMYFILLFFFSKCPLLLIKVDFDWDFALNKYSLRAYLQ
jgi:hypothetical protein